MSKMRAFLLSLPKAQNCIQYECTIEGNMKLYYIPASANGDILVILQKFINAVNDYKLQDQHAGRGELKR